VAARAPPRARAPPPPPPPPPRRARRRAARVRMMMAPSAVLLLPLLLLGHSLPVVAHGVATADSPCHQEMVKLCNATAGKGAPCLACEQRNKVALEKAGCTGGPGSKLSRFCGGAPSPSPRPGPSPTIPPHTADCPNGPAQPCKEPAKPKIASGYETSNLFWPGEQDAEGQVYTCTYCPMITLFNNTRLVALGGCTPSGCPGCNGIHVSDEVLRSPAVTGGQHEPRDRTGSACGAACIKTSDDGGRTWSKIRRFADHGVGGMINYDRVTRTIIVHHPSRLNISTPSGLIPGGSVVQITSPNGGETWTEPVDISKMLGPLFSPFVSSRGGLSVGPGAGIQLSATNKHHPNRLIFAGHHGAYQYDCVWYSDDHGKTFQLSKDASGKPLQISGQDEIALAETPDGGVITSE
jgi:hypothetical protein